MSRHLKDRSVAKLSGGERARVLVARALAQEAEYLIADEPTAGLDPAHSLALFEELRRLGDVRVTSVVTALHDLSLAARYATRIRLAERRPLHRRWAARPSLEQEQLSLTAFGIDAIVSEIRWNSGRFAALSAEDCNFATDITASDAVCIR